MEKTWRKRVGMYIAITFILAWALVAVFFFTGAWAADNTFAVMISMVMFVPVCGNALTRMITKERMEDIHFRLELKKHIFPFVLTWAVPIGATALGALLYFAVYPQQFDPAMSRVTEQLAAQGAQNAQFTNLSFLIINLLCAPLVNVVQCFGEEMGWRGYLQYALEKSGQSRAAAVLLTGVLSGLWYTPMIILGYQYGVGYAGYPYAGIGLFVLLSVGTGCFYSWLTYRTDSVIPAAMAHSAVNGLVQFPLLYLAQDAQPQILVGPMAIGILGMLPTLLLGAWFCYKTVKEGKAKAEPEKQP